MKLLILNLPYKRPIMRRYSCSYHAVGFLYPPLELLRVSAVIKKFSPEIQIDFTDSIAERISFANCLKKIQISKPDAIITMVSVDYINSEYEQIKDIKSKTGIPFIVIGYTPDLFRNEYSMFDIILGNNFEQAFHGACSSDFKDIHDFMALLKCHASSNNEFDPDLIPRADYSVIRPELYNDLFYRGKTAFTYYSFGCPFRCTFCIRTYNLSRSYFRSTELILKELEYFHREGYRNIRILDDNCTINKQLLKDICQFLNEKNLHFNFIGLTRFDLIDDETINLVAEMGFSRIYLGLETISEEKQQEYKKNIAIDRGKIDNILIKLKNRNIETGVFILFNPQTETMNDLKETLRFIKRLHVYFANLSFIVAYPGTPFFENNRKKISFNALPYCTELEVDKKISTFSYEMYFFFSYYVFNGFNFFRILIRYFKFPKHTFAIIKSIIAYAFSPKRERKDFI